MLFNHFFLQVILNWLRRLLCMKIPCLPQARRSDSCIDHVNKDLSHLNNELVEREPLKSSDGYIFSTMNGTNSSSAISNLETNIRSLHDLIKSAVDKINEREWKVRVQREVDLEWLSVALVLDRLFFLAYATVIVISLICLFPRQRWNCLLIHECCLKKAWARLFSNDYAAFRLSCDNAYLITWYIHHILLKVCEQEFDLECIPVCSKLTRMPALLLGMSSMARLECVAGVEPCFTWRDLQATYDWPLTSYPLLKMKLKLDDFPLFFFSFD